MEFTTLRSPLAYLKHMQGPITEDAALSEYETWWEREGKGISAAHDRAGTPWLNMFDVLGRRIDEIQCAPEYWTMLRRGYTTGVVWRAFDEQSLLSSFRIGYLCSFYDPGLFCPYTVSLSTSLPLSKYGDPAVKDRFLPKLLRKDDNVWQGATWMTEAGGGSDLGRYVETVARRDGDRWTLTGDKYFTSNAIADVAVVAARPEGASVGVKGLALFLVPKRRESGDLNYALRRLKDKIATRSVFTGEIELRNSEAYLLGKPEHGIYLILEVLNCSRVCNAIGSVALMQRALADALEFATQRVAFGKPIAKHPLLRRQIADRIEELERAHALAWESVLLFNDIWKETPPYSDRFHLFRIIVHLAKYWTAELAVQTAKWCMEVHGGMGTLAEYGVERWLREAMILAIWEGPPHRQILDGIEAMERKSAHRLLFQHLSGSTEQTELDAMLRRVESHLELPQEDREAGGETLFRELAHFTGAALRRRHAARA